MEQITIKIPDGWHEVSIAQYQEFLVELQNTSITDYKKIIKLLSILTDTDEVEFMNLPMEAIYQIDDKITFMDKQPTEQFRNIITINGREYGFQKNLNELTLGEWIDLEHYIVKGVMDNLHYIAAILYRPLIDKGDEYFDYTIKPYTEINLEANAKLFRYNVSIEEIFGISVFFYTTASVLMKPIISYLLKTNPTEMEARETLIILRDKIRNAEQKKKLTQLLENKDLKSGIGNYLSTLFVKEKYGDTIKS